MNDFYNFYILLSALCWNILLCIWLWGNKDRVWGLITNGRWAKYENE